MNNQLNNTRLSEAGTRVTRVCPECGHQFQGHGWTGIDAHWKSKHEHVMPYDIAWELIRKGEYRQSAAANNTRHLVYLFGAPEAACAVCNTAVLAVS